MPGIFLAAQGVGFFLSRFAIERKRSFSRGPASGVGGAEEAYRSVCRYEHGDMPAEIDFASESVKARRIPVFLIGARGRSAHQCGGADVAAVPAHAAAQFGAGAQESAFGGGYGYSQLFRYFRHGFVLHVSQQEYVAQ